MHIYGSGPKGHRLKVSYDDVIFAVDDFLPVRAKPPIYIECGILEGLCWKNAPHLFTFCESILVSLRNFVANPRIYIYIYIWTNTFLVDLSSYELNFDIKFSLYNTRSIWIILITNLRAFTGKQINFENEYLPYIHL